MLNQTQLFKIGLLAGLVLVLVAALAWLPGASAATYEIHPDIALDARSTPMAMVAAYERLTDQYLVLVQDHLLGISEQMRQMTRTLDAMDHRLAQLDERLAQLETRLPARPASAEAAR